MTLYRTTRININPWIIIIIDYNLLTDSEVITGKSQTEALMY